MKRDDCSPIVSILCDTYNHEKYIADALDGFIMQNTDFPIEIIVHDDASTDKTAEIIRSYELRYPELIFPIYQKINQYSNKEVNIWADITFPRARGKYIALCEGDDYWTDSLKLQRQVDFLEANEDCSLCFHPSKSIYFNNTNNFNLNKPKKIPADYKFDIKDIILGGGGFMATNSMVFKKNNILEWPNWMKIAKVGDAPLMFLLATKGKVGYIDRIMSIYRINSSPISWSINLRRIQNRKIHHITTISWLKEFDKWSNKKFHNVLKIVIRREKLNYYISYLKSLIFTHNNS